MRKDFTFTSDDGLTVQCYSWNGESGGGQKGIVQIVHGSLEHALRYEDFARELARQGYAVYACDLRGHGRTAVSEADLNYFSDQPRGWNRALADLFVLTDLIRKDHPEKPLFLAGHSMGSFLVRHYASEQGNRLDGILLSGTGGGRPVLVNTARALSRTLMVLQGRKKKSPFLHNLVYGTLNSAIENAETDYDFLSRDPATVKGYMDDPLSGRTATTEYIYEMTGGILKVMHRDAYAATPEGLPVLLFSGEKDPVAGPKGDAAELKDVYGGYKKAGLKDVTLKIYPEGRHEMLNEINRQEVYGDVLAWLDDRAG